MTRLVPCFNAASTTEVVKEWTEKSMTQLALAMAASRSALASWVAATGTLAWLAASRMAWPMRADFPVTRRFGMIEVFSFQFSVFSAQAYHIICSSWILLARAAASSERGPLKEAILRAMLTAASQRLAFS